MMTHEQLDALMAGDLVIVDGMGMSHTEAAVYRITRTTATKLTVACGDFSRRTGRRYGAGAYDTMQLSPAAPERVARIQERLARLRIVRDLTHRLTAHNAPLLTLDQLQRMLAITQEAAV